MTAWLPYSPPMRPRLRAPAALAAAALALHQLRYLAGNGEEAGTALAREGHAYLEIAGPLIALLVAVALAELAFAWRRRQPPGPPMSFDRRWVGAALALVLIYTVQESLEGILEPDRPGGIAAVLAEGGWLAAPIAVVLGWLVAVILRSTDALLMLRARSPHRLPRPTNATFSLGRRIAAPRVPLSRHLAGRAPPLAS